MEIKTDKASLSALIPGRYPYTYCADYIRGLTEELRLSRADAARILSVFAESIGFDREAAAYTFADAYLKKWQPEALAEAAIVRKARLESTPA